MEGPRKLVKETKARHEARRASVSVCQFHPIFVVLLNIALLAHF